MSRYFLATPEHSLSKKADKLMVDGQILNVLEGKIITKYFEVSEVGASLLLTWYSVLVLGIGLLIELESSLDNENVIKINTTKKDFVFLSEITEDSYLNLIETFVF